jgi:hypothetical protein
VIDKTQNNHRVSSTTKSMPFFGTSPPSLFDLFNIYKPMEAGRYFV